MNHFPIHRLRWNHAWRLIPTRASRIFLYDRLAKSHDQKLLIELEKLTNHRVQAEKGLRVLLRKQDSFPKNVSTYVRAAFAYRSSSRFATKDIPVLYSAFDEKTVLSERQYNWNLRLKAHRIPATSVQDIAFNLSIAGDFHDLRGLQSQLKRIYSPKSYSHSQVLGEELWNSGSEGIAYNSVRRPQGQCIAVYSPQTITSCARDGVYEYHWDGTQLTGTYQLVRR
jgi:hypothetical protein